MDLPALIESPVMMLTIQQATTDFLNHCQYEMNLSRQTFRFYAFDLSRFKQLRDLHLDQSRKTAKAPGRAPSQQLVILKDLHEFKNELLIEVKKSLKESAGQPAAF